MARAPALASRLNRRILIERPIADRAFDGAGSGGWERVDEVHAEVRDVLPGRLDRAAEAFLTMTRPSRIRIRYRTDITPDMRFVFEGRIMRIISGPAELGRREAVEFLVQEYRPAGNPA